MILIIIICNQTLLIKFKIFFDNIFLFYPCENLFTKFILKIWTINIFYCKIFENVLFFKYLCFILLTILIQLLINYFMFIIYILYFNYFYMQDTVCNHFLKRCLLIWDFMVKHLRQTMVLVYYFPLITTKYI